jgi:hypothetical protein
MSCSFRRYPIPYRSYWDIQYFIPFIQQYLRTEHQTGVECDGRESVALAFLVLFWGGRGGVLPLNFSLTRTNHLDRVSFSFFPHKYWCTNTRYVTVVCLPIPSNSLFTHHPVPQCFNFLSLLYCVHICVCMFRISGVPRGGLNPPPPEIPKALQNRTKFNPIVKTVKNCWI